MALVLIIDLHDLYFLLPVFQQLQLVQLREILPDAEGSDFLRAAHADDHVIKYEVRFGLDSLEGFEDIAVLFAVEIERMLGVEFCLQLLDLIR